MSDSTPQAAPLVQVRHEFSVVGATNESIAACTVDRRHGVLWISNVWTHYDHRRKGLATLVLRQVIALYGHEDLWLLVAGYTDRPMRDEQVLAWYARFGFCTMQAPGVMCRRGQP